MGPAATSKLFDSPHSHTKKEFHTDLKGLLGQLTFIMRGRTLKSQTLTTMHVHVALFSASHTCLKSVVEPEGVARNTMGFYTALVRQY